MATYTWEFGADGSGLHFTIIYDIVAGTFTVTSEEGKFDLNALWWNDGVADGSSPSLTGKDSSLNMNGSGEDWDGVVKLSNSGLGKEGEAKSTFISEGETATFTLADFGITGDFDPASGGTLGVRATSVNGGDSFKLVDTTPEYTPDDVPDDFPTWPQNISNVVLYFGQDAGDDAPVVPGGGTANDGDGFYLVKIDNVPSVAGDDLDAWIDDTLAWLVANDPNITADSDLLGAAIKGGTQSTEFYAYGDHNTNGTDPDSIPAGAPDIETPPAQGQVPGSEIDQTYNYADLGIA